MSGDVWLGPAESGGTPVGRRRGACGSGPFPAAPGPNRTGTFQRIRLSSGCHVQFAAGFRLPGARGIFRHRFGVLHYAYLPVSGHPSAAWPPSPCGRLSRPPWRGVTPATTTGPLSPWDSRPVGDPAFVPVIRASATQAPRSSPWMPSLGIAPALEVRPHPTPCGRSAGHRFHASFRRGQGFTPAGDQGSGNPALAISRGSPQRAARTHRHGRWFPGMLLSPSPFRSR
jgi:hypothetical protein